MASDTLPPQETPSHADSSSGLLTEDTSYSIFDRLIPVQLIDGLSNDILIVFICFAIIMAYLARQIFSLLPFSGDADRDPSGRIHPEAEGAIADTRRRLFGATGAGPASSGRLEGPDAVCPICLAQPLRFPIETNCGHCFCGRCFATYCAYDSNNLQPVRCPVCRQRVTLLLPGFAADQAQTMSAEDRRAVLDPLRHYNRRFSGEPRSWMELIADVPTLMRHLLSALFSESGLAFVLRLRVTLIMLFAALYLLSPIDLLPESLLGIFGLADDLFIFFLLAVYVTMIYRRYAAANPQFLGPGIEEANPAN